MKPDDYLSALLLVMAVLFGALIGAALSNLTAISLREEAIKRGHAEWRVANQATGRTEFQWKGAQP